MKLTSRYLLGLDRSQLERITEALSDEIAALSYWRELEANETAPNRDDRINAAYSRYLDAWKNTLDTMRAIQAEKDLKALLECKLYLCLPECEHLTLEETPA